VIETPPDNEDDAPRSSRANVAAVVAVLVLALLAYWAFTAIDHMRKVQRCLDEGRRNCQDLEK